MNWPAVTSMITALTAVGALAFTGLSLNATREQVAVAQAQNKVSEQGQVTDRYTKAVEQLDKAGANHVQARLGAIYSLERLARDSPRDQPTIIEVLSAFIRSNTSQHAPYHQGRAECPTQPVYIDVAAAVTVLGRRDVRHDNNTHIDLRGACLRDLFTSKANLSGAQLTGADLSDARLSGADLRGADLSGANLTGTQIVAVDLTGVLLENADLHGANLQVSGLIHADLSDADLSDADLYGANLKGANLDHVDLRGANLDAAVHDADTAIDEAVTDRETLGQWW